MLLVLSLPGHAVCRQWNLQYKALMDIQTIALLNWLTISNSRLPLWLFQGGLVLLENGPFNGGSRGSVSVDCRFEIWLNFQFQVSSNKYEELMMLARARNYCGYRCFPPSQHSKCTWVWTHSSPWSLLNQDCHTCFHNNGLEGKLSFLGNERDPAQLVEILGNNTWVNHK